MTRMIIHTCRGGKGGLEREEIKQATAGKGRGMNIKDLQPTPHALEVWSENARQVPGKEKSA